MEEKICEDCGNTKKLVPAGISKKTGRPYKEFYTCEACNPYGKSKKPAGGQLDMSHAEVMGALRKLYSLVDELKESFRLFTEAFTKKNEEVKDKDIPIIE